MYYRLCVSLFVAGALTMLVGMFVDERLAMIGLLCAYGFGLGAMFYEHLGLGRV